MAKLPKKIFHIAANECTFAELKPQQQRLMTRIGIISDTHGYLDERVFYHFEECHQIWHAGDIGTEEVARALEAFKPVKAVYGNIDGHLLRQSYPENQHFLCEETPVFITHIAGTPPKYAARVLHEIQTHKPAVLVCGHSHLLKVLRLPQFGNLLHINPGAAGKSGFHKVRTLIRLSIAQQRIYDLEVIELGKR